MSRLRLSDPLEALAAVDRPVVLRNEGDLRGSAAFGADRVVHLARGALVAFSALAMVPGRAAAKPDYRRMQYAFGPVSFRIARSG